MDMAMLLSNIPILLLVLVVGAWAVDHYKRKGGVK